MDRVIILVDGLGRECVFCWQDLPEPGRVFRRPRSIVLLQVRSLTVEWQVIYMVHGTSRLEKMYYLTDPIPIGSMGVVYLPTY